MEWPRSGRAVTPDSHRVITRLSCLPADRINVSGETWLGTACSYSTAAGYIGRSARSAQRQEPNCCRRVGPTQGARNTLFASVEKTEAVYRARHLRFDGTDQKRRGLSACPERIIGLR